VAITRSTDEDLEPVPDIPGPEQVRHLTVHDQHLVALNAPDLAAWAAGSWAAIPTTTVPGSAAHLTERLGQYAEPGITEIIYRQPVLTSPAN
jgi:hypothetical protein